VRQLSWPVDYSRMQRDVNPPLLRPYSQPSYLSRECSHGGGCGSLSIVRLAPADHRARGWRSGESGRAAIVLLVTVWVLSDSPANALVCIGLHCLVCLGVVERARVGAMIFRVHWHY